MRNIFIAVATFAFCGAAWAVDPLVGPGKPGEKDPQGHLNANAGAGPHEHFQPQLERQVEKPEKKKADPKKQLPEKQPSR